MKIIYIRTSNYRRGVFNAFLKPIENDPLKKLKSALDKKKNDVTEKEILSENNSVEANPQLHQNLKPKDFGSARISCAHK